MADENKKYITKQELSDGSVKEAISLTTETFIDQEFAYRKSPKTLDVNTFNLDKIKGKTLTWNQLVQNGDFSQGTANWYHVGGTVLSASDGILTVDCTNPPTQGVIGASIEQSVIVNHKYYVAFDVKFSSADFEATPTFYIGSAGLYGVPGCVSVDVQKSAAWAHYSSIGTIGSDTYETTGLRLYDATSQTIPASFQLKKVQVFDLTLMFGAGDEPSTVAEFEALYPLVYYAYNPSELVNNKAKALENVGFNQWDEEWELGDIDANGQNHENDTRIRSKNYIPVISGATYFFHSSVNTWYEIYFYDGNKNYISFIDVYIETFVIPSGICYMRFYGSGAYPPPYNHDICINLSDPAKNGTYEPHKRVVLPLNLADLEVISPNIWDEEWERGSYGWGDGQKESGNYIRSAGFIPVSPGKAYYINGFLSLFEYDANQQYLRTFGTTQNVPVTFGEDTHYITFRTAAEMSTYANDICINESDPGHNGHYYPHGTFKPFPDGLRSTDNDTYDEIIGAKVIRRIKKSVGSEFTLHNTSSANYKTYKTTLTDGYNQSTPVQHWVDNFGINYNGVLNSDSVSVETVQYDGGSGGIKTFYVSVAPGRNIDNFVLYYKLAVPEEFDLVTPLPLSTFSGTIERRLPEDTENDVMAPFECDMTYGTNNEQILDIIDTKYVKPSGGIPASDLASGVIPTVPTISTDISSDASSNTKTTSPKAVKTYVDGICGDIETILATI